MKRDCQDCRYWSQMCAQALDGGPIEALCLNNKSPKHGRFTRADASCPAWKVNSHGAVDEPPDYGESVRAIYEAEENGDAAHDG